MMTKTMTMVVMMTTTKTIDVESLRLNVFFLRGLGGPCTQAPTASTSAGERTLSRKGAWKGALPWEESGEGALPWQKSREGALPGQESRQSVQGPGEGGSVQWSQNEGGWNRKHYLLLERSRGPDSLDLNLDYRQTILNRGSETVILELELWKDMSC